MTHKQGRGRQYGFLLIGMIGLIVVVALVILSTMQSGAPPSNNTESTTGAAPTSGAMPTQSTISTSVPSATSTSQPTATAQLPATPTLDLLSTKSGGGQDTTSTQTTPGQPESTVVYIPPVQPSLEVAAVPVKIVSESGVAIGDGTLRVFAPGKVEYPQTARVELELRLDNRYITPTPFGAQVTIIPLTPVTATPLPGQPTPTPRLPIHETQGIQVFQRMGASLLCLPESFAGCDLTIDPTSARLIDVKGASWSWIVRPAGATQALQDLRLTLWTLKRVNDGPEQADVVWEHPFQIEITPVATGLSPFVLISIGIAILAAFGAVFYNQFRSSKRSATRRSKPTAFISYRRQSGWSTARTIHDRLTALGADVFLDVDDINEGRFEDIIKKAIETREYFILVLAPDTIASEWVLKEATYALQHNRKIIPVLVEGFNLADHPLPPELAGIQSHNAITLTPEYFNAGMERLATFVGL